MRKKRGEQHVAPATGAARITPSEVQQVEFRLAFRGYNERDVDAFLDRVTEDLSAYLDELQRLRSADGAPATGGTPSAPDADATRREADLIVSRAREQADAIVREAEARAAAIGAGAAGGDARSAVGPFLNREREFLQSLGGLVQTHAEEIKQMVLALRDRAPSPGAEAAPAPPPDAPAGAASASEIRRRLGEPESAQVAGPAPRVEPAPEEPVIVESATEPAYSSEGAPASEGRERSLRELFWGED